MNQGGEVGGNEGAVGGLGASVGAASDSGMDSGMGAPSIGGASPAGDLSGGLGDLEASIAADESAVGGLVDSAGGMEFGGQGAVGSQGNVAGSQHAGTAGDSFSDAVAALDAAIGSMPNLEPGGITYGMEQATAPPSTGLPGMGYGGVTNENFDPMGSSHMGQFGQGTGIAAPGQTFGPGAAAPSGVMSALGTPNLGWGDDPFGDTMAPTNTVDPGLQAANASALSQSQGLTADVGWAGAGTPTNVGNPMGYGMYGAPATAAEEGSLDGIAQSAQDQRSAAAQTIGNIEQESDNAFDVSQYGQLSMNQQQAPGRTDAEGGGPIGAANMSQAEADALDGWSGGLQATGQDIDTEDENEDYSGMPTGATVDQTVGALIQAIQDPKEAKNRGWLAHDLARSILGLPPSTPESRAKDALSSLESQGQQEAMEMDVSTGEDDRTRRAKLQAVSDFRKKYKWAANMSPKEIQAYIDNPALLNLKTSNEQMKSMDPKNMTANDIRQLWSPAMSA